MPRVQTRNVTTIHTRPADMFNSPGDVWFLVIDVVTESAQKADGLESGDAHSESV